VEQSSRTLQPTDDRLLLLIEQQKQTKEGSTAWYAYQAQINQIIAENFLHYVNR
jgi:hypothetical protein